MRTFLLLALLHGCSSAWAMSVTFIAPGYPHEAYWLGVSEVMQRAAQDLGIQLTTKYAERDRLREISLVGEIAALPAAQRPDYLIVAGEKRTLPEQLKLAEIVQLPIFLIANNPTDEERPIVGQPRERFKNWLGSLTPQMESAGYMTGRALIEAGLQAGLQDQQGQLHMLALSGSRSTDASIRRNRGLHRALTEFPQVVLHQWVHAEWRQDKAYFQTQHLLRRYPQTSLIWSGSDLMAFGAMQAAEEAGHHPGQDLLFSAINTSQPAMQAVIAGRLSALAGGHYMAGAWALVVLYDYHQGIDFAQTEGLEMERPLFTLFSPAQAQHFLEAAGATPDFRKHSKALNPALLRYDFSYCQLPGSEG